MQMKMKVPQIHNYFYPFERIHNWDININRIIVGYLRKTVKHIKPRLFLSLKK